MMYCARQQAFKGVIEVYYNMTWNSQCESLGDPNVCVNEFDKLY